MFWKWDIMFVFIINTFVNNNFSNIWLCGLGNSLEIHKVVGLSPAGGKKLAVGQTSSE